LSKEPFLRVGIVFLILSGIFSFFISLPELSVISKSDNASLIYQTYKPRLFLSYTQGYFEAPDVLFFQKNSLVASPALAVNNNVFGSLIGPTSRFSIDKRGITEYEIKDGDTASLIATKFNISISTILLNNNLSNNSILKPGKKLIILPVDGLIHHVSSGDTLSGLAKTYQAKTQDIIDYNSLGQQGKIFIGDVLVVPYAKKPVVKYGSSIVKPLPSSYFICPISVPCRITQGLHWYNAIDFSHGVCGDSILAAAGGVVQKTGYHNIGGNYVRILHPNGVVTYYGHMSKILVSAGQKVVQGQVIGYMGYTGYTIPRGPGGCHVHFEVRGAKNPFSR